MKIAQVATISVLGAALSACNSLPQQVSSAVPQIKIVHPSAGQSRQIEVVEAKPEGLRVARNATLFTDTDIRIPAGAATVALQGKREADRPVLRIFFTPPEGVEAGTPLACGEQKRGPVANHFPVAEQFANYVAGSNRFQVSTWKGCLSNAERAVQVNWLGEERAAHNYHSKRREMAADYLVQVDSYLNVEQSQQPGIDLRKYNLRLRTSVLDPYAVPPVLVGEPRISETVVERVDKVLTHEGPHGIIQYGGESKEQLLSGMYDEALQVMVNKLVNAMPATARVVRMDVESLTLDQGVRQGLAMEGEVMVLFQRLDGLAKPLAVAEVRPERDGFAHGEIIMWKESRAAQRVKRAAEQAAQNHRTLDGETLSLYAASVAAPERYRF